MPTYDGGHYFLTALVPIKWREIRDGTVVTSPVHALRKQLELLPPAAQTPACSPSRQSPFAKSLRTHFARLVVIDDVAYPGRSSGNTLVAAATGEVLTDAQPQDNLNSAFLLFVADFDATSGDDSERDSYLSELWDVMADDLKNLFQFCQGFDATDAKSFAAYIAKCQLETTMSFNDYYAVMPNLPTWPASIYKWGVIIAGAALGIGVLATIALLIAALCSASVLPWLRDAVWLSLAGGAALILVALVAYMSVMAAGKKPFPAASDSDLRSVLKSLHIQRAFTRFVIENQELAAKTDEASAQTLYDAFKAFVATNKPYDRGEPTQAPGVIGF
jgi:hypothetical protein